MSGGTRELPMDLMVEVILRMEVKHILRCKLLSKTFYSLIKSPSFVSAHLHRSKANKRHVALLAGNRTTNVAYILFSEFRFIVPPLDIPGKVISLIGSCNGLLCILTQPRDNESRYESFLCNPTTGEYRALPMTHFCGYYNFGFGYDAISGDYKVVKICKYNCERPFSVNVWSMSTNEWREVHSALPNLLEGYEILCSGSYVRGNLYWKVRPRRARSGRAEIIFSVSLADHTVRQIPMPDVVVQNDSGHTYLTKYMGLLAMFLCRITISSIQYSYDLWVMEANDDRKMSWAIQVSSIGPFTTMTVPTRVCVNDDIVMVQRLNGKTFLYNPHAKEITEIPLSNSRWIGSTLWSLDESIVSLKNSLTVMENTDDKDIC